MLYFIFNNISIITINICYILLLILVLVILIIYLKFPPHPQNFNLKRSAVHMRRPDSQATSVKAEPGSARGSTASASGKIISSHSHAAESIRSFVEDTTILSPGCAPKVKVFSMEMIHYIYCFA